MTNKIYLFFVDLTNFWRIFKISCNIWIAKNELEKLAKIWKNDFCIEIFCCTIWPGTKIFKISLNFYVFFRNEKYASFVETGNMSTNCCRVNFCWLLESVRLFYFRGVAFRGRKSLDFCMCGKKSLPELTLRVPRACSKCVCLSKGLSGSTCKKWKGLTSQFLLWWLPD